MVRAAESVAAPAVDEEFFETLGIAPRLGRKFGSIAFSTLRFHTWEGSVFRAVGHKTLMPATALIGAFIALAADLATSLPGTQQVLHVNHATALIGCPVILWSS